MHDSANRLLVPLDHPAIHQQSFQQFILIGYAFVSGTGVDVDLSASMATCVFDVTAFSSPLWVAWYAWHLVQLTPQIAIILSIAMAVLSISDLYHNWPITPE